jgi:hypothetical protein
MAAYAAKPCFIHIHANNGVYLSLRLSIHRHRVAIAAPNANPGSAGLARIPKEQYLLCAILEGLAHAFIHRPSFSRAGLSFLRAGRGWRQNRQRIPAEQPAQGRQPTHPSVVQRASPTV